MIQVRSDGGKRQITKMAGWLWVVRVGFRLHCRDRHRLSKCSCFGPKNGNYRYRNRLSTFSAVVVSNLFKFRYPTLIKIHYLFDMKCAGVFYPV